MHGPMWGRIVAHGCSTALLLVSLTHALAHAQYFTPDQCDECTLCGTCLKCCHEPPELWVINTRCAPRCCNLDEGFGKLRFQRYDAQCKRFVSESLESFLASEATMPSLFYVHGNYLEHSGAMKAFWQVYHKMRCCPGPKRLVCWSWPAQRVYRGLRVRKIILDNLRIKVVYAEYQGYYLARLLQQMSFSQRVMISGHSFGAIVATSAAHWMGGGQLRGLTLAGGTPNEQPNLRLSLISGAFDKDALYPGCRYGQAMVAVEKIMVTRNIRDSTLGIWKNVSYRNCSAIGTTGVNANRLGQYANKLCQITMTADVRRSHFLEPHLDSARMMSMLCCLAFPQCQECQCQECMPVAEKIDSAKQSDNTADNLSVNHAATDS
jgi:hypothetical protein